ncbi:GNAT family N-acetyltransferase [uncultured Arcticibacterium sp.]|uniref:GNAT family N-acetyltransferase n=1 Tax=uncultured Arcticibacterium sp. TaxID=2173042 RepID=UPI0030F504D8
MKIKISIGNINNCIEVSDKIPEFSDKKYDITDYKRRLDKTFHLILIAYDNNEAVGFKVGYDRDKNGTFYSWMGGVIPEYRQRGVAKELAKRQEQLVRKEGFKFISFKTRNYLKAMLVFGIRNGFNITGIEEKNIASENRIILKKALN